MYFLSLFFSFLSLVPLRARACGVVPQTIPTFHSLRDAAIVFTILVSASGFVLYVYCTVKSSRISFESAHWSRTVFDYQGESNRDDVRLSRTPTSSI